MVMQHQAVYSKAMREKAEALVAKSDKWAEGRRNADGVRFILFASATRVGVYYFTRIDGAFCSCPAGSKSRSGRCCHQLACQIVTERAQEQAAKPSRPTYEDLWIGSGMDLTDAF